MSSGKPVPKLVYPRRGLLSQRFSRVEFDAEEIEAAELALKEFAAAHAEGLFPIIQRLCDAWDEEKLVQEGASVARSIELNHELAGLGSTLGFPLVTRICRSLAGYLRRSAEERYAAQKVIEGHFGVLATLLSDHMAGRGRAGAEAAAEELDRSIARFELGVGD